MLPRATVRKQPSHSVQRDVGSLRSERAKACRAALIKQVSRSQIWQPGAAQRIISGAAYQTVVISVMMV